MKYDFLVIIIIVFTLTSCSKNTNFSWKVYNSEETNLKKQKESFESFIFHNNDIYLIGVDRPIRNLIKQKSVIYKSDFNHKNWNLILSDNGIFYKASTTKTNIYLIRETFTKKNSFADTKSHLCKLDIKNNSFQIITELKGLTKNIHFENDSLAYLFQNNPSNPISNELLTTKNGGYTWDTITISKTVEKSHFHKNRHYLVENRYDTILKKRLSDKLFKTNLSLKKTELVNLNVNVTDFSIINEEEILILCETEGVISVELYDGRKAVKLFEFDKNNDLFPKKIHNYGNFIAVVLGKLNSTGTTNHLFLSFDKGKSFNEEKLPINYYADPIGFYKNEKIIIYSGAGRISVCDLKEPI